MGNNVDELQHSIYKTPSFTGGCLEIRLFYVRIAPCAVDSLPDHLTLYYLRRESGVLLEINGTRIPSSDAVSITLRRDRVDKDCFDVTYISTDSARSSGPLEFEVYEEEEDMDLILCGSLQRVDAAAAWSNGGALENDSKTGWSMNCYASNTIVTNDTILVTPRRKALRKGMLDVIPENEEIGKEQRSLINGQQSLQNMEADRGGHESEWKLMPNYYSEDMYFDDDGQLSWFNAGVRVGVGIGLGMCVGVGLLMRSYRAATWSFRRRFF
ncbi:hypothetical protein ACS0TY_019351 [Phlomoides rotata]